MRKRQDLPGRKHIMMFPGGLLSCKEPACQRRRWEASPRVRKTPGEGTATHSGILDWEIPCTEEPGGLQPTWSQRARHSNNKAEHGLSKRCFPSFWEVSEEGAWHCQERTKTFCKHRVPRRRHNAQNTSGPSPAITGCVTLSKSLSL